MTDLHEKYPYTDIEFDADIDIGDVHILDTSGNKVNFQTDASDNLQIDIAAQSLTDVSVTNSDIPTLSTNASNQLEIDLAAAAAEPLDVSAATVTVTNSDIPTLSTDASDNLQVDIPGQPLDVSAAAVNVVEAQNESTVNHGQDTVSTAGTEEALNGGTSLAIPDGSMIVIRALNSNTGTVYVGDGTVSSSNGFELDSGEQSPPLKVDDVSDISIDVDNGGEGVSWIVEG